MIRDEEFKDLLFVFVLEICEHQSNALVIWVKRKRR